MPDTVCKVHYYSTSVPDRPGQAFRVLQALVSNGVNLLACVGTTRGRRAYIDVVPGDTRRFRAAVRRTGLKFSEKKTGFMIQGADRPGALTEHLQRLAQRQINVTAVDGMAAGAGRWAAIVWVDARDVARAGRVLRAGGCCAPGSPA